MGSPEPESLATRFIFRKMKAGVMEKLYKAWSIIKDLTTKKPVRVDWRCFARVVGRVGGFLTREELDWLENHLKEVHGIGLDYDELSPPFEDETWDYEDIELKPVQLLKGSDVEFANQIMGYVVSYPLENVDSVEDFLTLTDNIRREGAD